jgi:hypothetical protein
MVSTLVCGSLMMEIDQSSCTETETETERNLLLTETETETERNLLLTPHKPLSSAGATMFVSRYVCSLVRT